MPDDQNHLIERIIDARMGLGVVESGVVMAVLTLLTLDLFLPGGLIEPINAWLGAGPHSLELARTAAFSNRWLWAAVALSTTLQGAVVHLPFLNLAFGTVPLSVGQWCVCVAMASGVLWFSEGRKLFRRLWTQRALAPPGQ